MQLQLEAENVAELAARRVLLGVISEDAGCKDRGARNELGEALMSGPKKKLRQPVCEEMRVNVFAIRE